MDFSIIPKYGISLHSRQHHTEWSTPDYLGETSPPTQPWADNIIPSEECDIAEGIHNNEYQDLIALNMIENCHEDNEGGTVHVIHKSMSHIPIFLLYQYPKRI